MVPKSPMRYAIGVAALFLAVGGCAPIYARSNTTQAEFTRDAEACRFEALTTPPPYQMGLPEYGYGYPYGRRASAGDGAGLLLAVMLERATTNAWRDDFTRRCLIAMGYQEVR